MYQLDLEPDPDRVPNGSEWVSIGFHLYSSLCIKAVPSFSLRYGGLALEKTFPAAQKDEVGVQRGAVI